MRNTPEYVMTQVPTRAEMNERFEQVDEQLHEIHQQIDLVRTEQAVFAKTFELHDKRITMLGERNFGYRVRDKDEESQ